MLTFKGSIAAVDGFKKICEELVGIKLAEEYKKDNGTTSVGVTGYNLDKFYQLFIDPHGFELGGTANVRFWRDERTNNKGFKVNRAAISCTKKGLETILRSATVIDILRNNKIKLKGADGKIDLAELTRAAQLINSDIITIEKVSDEEYNVITKENE